MKMKILYILLLVNILFADNNDVYVPICYDECIEQCEKKVNKKNICHEICLNCVVKNKI